MSLLELPLETPATIMDIATDDRQLRRLYALGIGLSRTIVKKQQTFHRGPVVITTAHHCNYALGHELAALIEVEIKK